MIRIETKKDLQILETKLGLRQDWHEPDNSGVDAKVYGEIFDNAGFWGTQFKTSPLFPGEMFVILFVDDDPIAEINLATLFSIACQ